MSQDECVMLVKRLIPVVLLRDGVVVQSRQFRRYQNLGNPVGIVQRLSAWSADEMIYLDISREGNGTSQRKDLKMLPGSSLLEVLGQVSENANMPLTFGGGIRSLDEIAIRIQGGADKVTLNTIALDHPEFVQKAAHLFGSQCIVVSVDVISTDSGWFVYDHRKKNVLSLNPVEWVRRVEGLGAGEIFLNSVDRDGMGSGYDVALADDISKNIQIPVIVCGGVGEWSHFEEVLLKTHVSAVAAANIFHYSENSVFHAKKYLHQRGIPVRMPDLFASSGEVHP